MNSCRLCHSLDINVLYTDWGKSHRCNTCEAITRDLTNEEYKALAPTYDPGPSLVGHSGDEIRRYLGVDDKIAFLKQVFSASSWPKTILDIGCGAGGYLLAAQELGCTAVGVEPSESHSTIARGLGLNVINSYFDDSAFESESFDFVLLSHVIEHIYDPMDFLRKVMKVVRANGLIVLVTPNSASSVSRISGRHWVMLKPIDHVSMLSERSLLAGGITDLGSVEFLQTEYPWEPAMALAAAIKDVVRRRKNVSASSSNTKRVVPMWKSIFLPIKRAVSIIAYPLHIYNKLNRAQSCLVISVRKTASEVS